MVCVPMILMTSFLFVRDFSNTFIGQILKPMSGYQHTLTDTHAKLACYTAPSTQPGDYCYLDICNNLYSDGACGWRPSSTASACGNGIFRLPDHYERRDSKLLGNWHLCLELGRSIYRSRRIRRKSSRTAGQSDPSFGPSAVLCLDGNAFLYWLSARIEITGRQRSREGGGKVPCLTEAK